MYWFLSLSGIHQFLIWKWRVHYVKQLLLQTQNCSLVNDSIIKHLTADCYVAYIIIDNIVICNFSHVSMAVLTAL